ncbi:MAG TPA: hypothetical protein VLV16_11185 [Gemmatimonadales bacterium]|nr:hypothetical protein [Gemmatimonadales bacterium]
MRAKWVSLLVLAAAAAAACGIGKAVLVVDLYSFIKGSGQDTIPYFVPPGTVTASNTPRRTSLPGAGASIVDSVTIVGTLDLQNQTGAGTIGLQLYVAADSAGSYLPGALALNVPAKPVSGAATVPDTIRGRLAPGADSLFRRDEVWTRFQVTGSNGGVTLMQGRAVLKSIQLTIVLDDKLF